MPGPNFTGLDKGMEATGAIRQYRAVIQAGNEKCTEASVAGNRVVGVCQEEITAADATSGRVANIRLAGITYAIAGATGITRDARVGADAQGRMIVATVGQTPCGVVRDVPGTVAVGDFITVQLTPGLPVV